MHVKWEWREDLGINERENKVNGYNDGAEKEMYENRQTIEQ